MQNPKVPSNYFKLTYPGTTIFLVVGIGLMFITWLAPHSLSRSYVGYMADVVAILGTEHNHYVKLLVLTVMGIHTLETIYGIYLCYKMRLHPCVTLAWALQILAVGVISLRFLIWPEVEESNHKNIKKK